MRSIQTKIIAAAAAFIAVAVLAVLGVAVFDLQKMQDQHRQIGINTRNRKCAGRIPLETVFEYRKS